MLNFEIVNPTRVIFGKDQLDRLPELLSAQGVSNVLIAYGGGTVNRIGLLEKVAEKLSNFNAIEFGGIEANPDYVTLMKAVDVCRKESVDFILAVGGGSVIDGVKFISGAIGYKGEPWDVLEKKEGCEFNTAVPFGTILTLPATGSEVNSGAVISYRKRNLKRVMGGPLFFPVFSFCDPSMVATIPKRQLANGIIDAFMHTLEQYLTYPTDNLLQEREAEAILATLIEIKDVVDCPEDYKLASNFMLCASHALNGNLRCGVPTDWTTHMIGHELTALYGIDHAQSLAIVAPRLFEHEFDKKYQKLAQYGRRIWNLSGEDQSVAKQAIEKTEGFFKDLGVSTRLSEYTNEYEGTDIIIRDIFQKRNWLTMGENQSITPEDVRQIVESTY